MAYSEKSQVQNPHETPQGLEENLQRGMKGSPASSPPCLPPELCARMRAVIQSDQIAAGTPSCYTALAPSWRAGLSTITDAARRLHCAATARAVNLKRHLTLI